MAEQLPLLFFLLALSALGSCSPAGSNNSTPAIFVFGDSTVDPGNNNFLPTLFKSNFPPYGKNYPQQRPTGRFTDGKLVTDFLASYMGLKDEIPPYLNPTLSEEELLTGVSFASAGSGYDPLTAKLGDVISIPNQLEYFKDYLNKRRLIIGENRTEDLIRRSVYVVSCGTNDFVNNYFALPIRRTSFSIHAYQLFVLQKLGDFLQHFEKRIFVPKERKFYQIGPSPPSLNDLKSSERNSLLWLMAAQGLRDLGARRIGLVALPPFGCLPIVRTLHPTNSSTKSGCIESLNSVAKDFNSKLQHLVASMKMNLGPTGGSFVYADMYQTLADIIYSPDQFGFVESRRGCCGTGYIEFSFLCNHKCEVCEDASKYVFWDAIHPTEKTYYFLFQAFRGAIDDFLLEQS